MHYYALDYALDDKIEMVYLKIISFVAENLKRADGSNEIDENLKNLGWRSRTRGTYQHVQHYMCCLVEFYPYIVILKLQHCSGLVQRYCMQG